MAIDMQLLWPQTVLEGVWARWGRQWHLRVGDGLACGSRAKKYERIPDENAAAPTGDDPQLCNACLQVAIGHRARVYERRGEVGELVTECSCGWYETAEGRGAKVRSALRAAHEGHAARQLHPSTAHDQRAQLVEAGHLSEVRAQFLDQLVPGGNVRMVLGAHEIEGRVHRVMAGDRPIVVAYQHQQRHGVQGLERTATRYMSFDAQGLYETPRATWLLEPVTWNSLGDYAPDTLAAPV